MREIESPEQAAYLEEIRSLGKDAMALLRQAQALDATLRGIPKTSQNAAARSAIIAQRESLHRQRYTTLVRQKEIIKAKDRERHAALLGDAPTVTAAVREAARRVGIMEHLYLMLCEHLDDVDGDFDWRKSVMKARRQLAGPTD